MSRRVPRALALAGAAVLAITFAACGDDDDDDSGGSANDELIAAMVSEGATDAEARCFVDEVGDDAERLFTAADEDLSEEDEATLLAAFQACAADGDPDSGASSDAD